MNTAIRSQRDAIRGMLADLKMPGSLEAVDGILSDIDSGHLGAPEAINRLLSAQITLRNNRRLQAAMRSSRLPAVKTLESFDFSFQPSIKREQIESLHAAPLPPGEYQGQQLPDERAHGSISASAVGRRQLRRGRKTASQAKGGKREQRLRKCAILARQN